MSADRDEFADDLYGDLDQLEEVLEDPPDLDPQMDGTAKSDGAAQVEAQISTDSEKFGGDSSQGMSGQNGMGQAQFGGGELSSQDRLRSVDASDEGKMFIGGLNWETTDEGLKAYMGKYGEIDACTIMRDPNGRSRGFAFLTYVDPDSVNKVMGEVHQLDGKQIDPKRAIPRAEHERTAKVFVGGLAPNVTSETLKSFLMQYGMVMDATVMYDRETGRSKGFAFATFADETSVGIAMAASGVELDGKPIEIKKAQPRGSGNLVKNFHAPSSQGRFNNNGGGMGGGQGQMAMGMGMPGYGGGGMNAGFDPNAMSMMYQNMMKGAGMGDLFMVMTPRSDPGAKRAGTMGMGFDPNAMAMMYQNMLKSMGNAPAINPNMAMRNNMGMGMGMGMMGNMGMGGMGGMGMPGMGGMGGMGFGGGMGQNAMGGNRPRPMPNAPRGPAAMRNGPAGGGNGTGAGASAGTAGSTTQTGPGAQRYSTQGSARTKPY